MSRKTHMLLVQAVRKGFNFTPDDPPAPPADDPKGKGKTKTDPPADDSVTLTKAELEQRVKDAAADAVRKANDAATEKQRKADEERAQKEAQEQGKWKELADGEKSKREQAETRLAALERSTAIDKAIAKAAAAHAEYPLTVFTEYVSPKLAASIEPDADAKAIEKAATEAVAQYVKDNPRKAVAAPPANPGRNLPPKPGAKGKEEDENNRHQFSRVARQAF